MGPLVNGYVWDFVMINWPAPPSGLSTEASWFRKLLMACRQTEILPGVGYRVKETSNGRILDILKQPVPSFTQVPGMHPFRIYKPNLSALPTTGLIFDMDGNPSSIAIDSTAPTNLPTTVNPGTDAWRFWAVRNGLVQYRSFYTGVGETIFDIFDWNAFGGSESTCGTDGITPFQNVDYHQFPYDESTTIVLPSGEPYPHKHGNVLVLNGSFDDVASNGFGLWIKIEPDGDGVTVGISVIGQLLTGGETDIVASSFIIPIGKIIGDLGYFSDNGTWGDLITQQFLFDHVLNRYPIGMFSNGKPLITDTLPGASIYRGDWDNDDIQDQIFYGGDFIQVRQEIDFSASSSGGINTTITPNKIYSKQLWMMIGEAGFTTDPTTDPDWIQIGGITT